MSERTIEDIRAAFFKVHAYATHQPGAIAYMSIPADPRRDADLIVVDAIEELDALRADNRRLRGALEAAHEQACRFGCASKWRTADGEESRHTDVCRKARAALSGAKPDNIKD